MPVEYAGEEQAICAVGLAKPKPGIFMAAIQHLLVLCTTTEARGALCQQQAIKTVGLQQAGRPALGRSAPQLPMFEHGSSTSSNSLETELGGTGT